ncbi:MAG TPA: hypothetical protein VF518_03280, partial [Polyangia bacterium]
GSLTFGGQTITCPTAGNQEAFVAAVDANTGAGLWALQPHINGSSLGLAADPLTNDFVVCGTEVDLAATGLAPKADPADSAGDIVVARLDASTGKVKWGRQIAAAGAQTCDSVAIDSSGQVFLAGTVTGPKYVPDGGTTQNSFDLGSGISIALPSANSTVIWIAALDGATGSAKKALRFDAPNAGKQEIRQITTDAAGHLLLVGDVSKTARMGTRSLTATALKDILVVKLDPQLEVQWADNWGDSKNNFGMAVAADPAGLVVVAGEYLGPLHLDGTALARGGAISSGFVARLDGSTGKVLSARGYASPGATQTVRGLQVVGSGQEAGMVWLAGNFTGLLQLGPPVDPLSNTVAVGFLSKVAQ